MTPAASLVSPLEPAWNEAIDALLRARGWPTSHEASRLGALVARLSATYNAELREIEGDRGGAAPLATDLLAARLGFSFPRDVPKGAGAVRELVATGALALPADRPLRVLDLGAGLGAATWGIVRALAAAGGRGAVEATWLDADARALELGAELARRAPPGPIALSVKTRTADLSLGSSVVANAGGPYDVIVLCQVLSELDAPRAGAPDRDSAGERAARHAELVGALVSGALDPNGALVVIEPALRDRTRHLHRVRAAIVASGVAGIFAPCLHQDACPFLARENDWCHEDLAVDLPPWLVPVARSAGLRWQGLTFSYLALRKDGRTLDASTKTELVPVARLRAVSDLFRTKGKIEVDACGSFQPGAAGTHARVMRLDRDESDTNVVFEELRRGDLFAVESFEEAEPTARRRGPPREATGARAPRIRAGTRVVRPSFVDDAGSGR